MLAQLMYRLGLFKLFETMKIIVHMNICSAHLKLKNIGIYMFVYIFIELAIFIRFLLSSTVMFFSALHAKHFEIWKNIS